MTARVEYDEKSENGLIFGEQYLPEELLAEILCYVNYNTLLNCQLVCKRWRILIESYVWRKKAEMSLGRQLAPNKNVPWTQYYLICKKRPFERNLIKNCSGKHGVARHWKILSEGGNQWAVENPPIGVPPLPADPILEGEQFCFATSFNSCTKMQTIDLEKEGLLPFVLDELQPPILVSEWYSCRWDCPAVYECSMQLLKEDNAVIDSFQFRGSIEGEQQNQWHYVSHEFKNYGPGLRKVSFYHGGMDKSYWEGHYGSKMAGACVYIKVPNTLQTAVPDAD